MAEAANVRLVLCPKCEELLPELPDFSIYKCGGCGAVLRAKGKGILENGHSKILDDANVGRNIEKDTIVRASEVLIDGEKEAAVNGVVTGRGEETVCTSQHETAARAADSYRKGTGQEGGVNFRGISDREHHQDSVRNKKPSKNCDLNADRPEYAYFDANGRDVRVSMDSMKLGPAADSWDDLHFESGPSRMQTRVASGQARIKDFVCHEDGMPSERARCHHGYNPGAVKPENPEIDRMELLRRLDELRDQLSRSNDAAASPGCCRGHNASYPQSLSNSQAISSLPLIPDEMGPHCFSHSSSKFASCTKSYGSRTQECAVRGCVHEVPPFADQFRNERNWRPSYHRQHMHQAYDHRFPHYYGEDMQDLYLPRRHESLFRQETCHCWSCCGKSQQRTSIDQQFCSARNQHSSFPTTRGPQPSDTGDSRLRPPHHWNSNELDSSDYPRKMAVAHGNKQVSLPVAGGAPFITCYNCFELVKLPRKHISTVKTPQKVKCGACSSIIFFEFGSKDSVAPVLAHGGQIPTEIDDASIETGDENGGYWNDDFYCGNRNTCSDDSQHKFAEAYKKENSSDFERGPLNHLSSSSSLSQDGASPDNGLSSLRVTHLSPRELSDHGHGNIVENSLDKETRSRGREDVSSLERSTSLRKSTEDHAVASEIDVPSNELSNGYASQDSMETNKEHPPKSSKGVDSFLSNLMKKSFKKDKSNHSGEVREAQVFVNGHPVPERAVKKAEKLAGPIQPGEYWYDIKAGFWGVMGHPCLGIIMPNIEEFSHPMPEDCAAGNTAVYVNGRELHQKDLDLLATRGLPITRNRSYLIEINGEVVDEQTGEALDGLGKLAPTVERVKHGFGMKVPRSVAQTQI